MADGKMGLGAVLTEVLLRPRRFFESVKAGEVAARPFWVYLTMSVLGAAGSGMALAGALGGSAMSGALLFAGAGLLFAPVSWLIDAQVTHLVARVLGGTGALQETKAAVGFSTVPTVFGILPYGSGPAFVWALILKVQGLRSLHSLKTGRAVAAAVAALLVVLIVPVSAALLLRGFVLEAFKVPAGSMFPSIEIGDHLFVTKWSYGVLTKSAPTRGDVVVFEYPEPMPDGGHTDYVKRVIGVPGDELAFVAGAPSINGWAVPRCPLGTATVALDALSSPEEFEVFVEFLEGRAYLVAHDRSHADGRQGPYRVKPGEYWVLGDNRNNSADSRVWNGGRGAGVPFQNSRGRARWLWFPPERMGVDLAAAPSLPANLLQLAPELARCMAVAPDLEHTRPPPPPSAN